MEATGAPEGHQIRALPGTEIPRKAGETKSSFAQRAQGAVAGDQNPGGHDQKAKDHEARAGVTRGLKGPEPERVQPEGQSPKQ